VFGRQHWQQELCWGPVWGQVCVRERRAILVSEVMLQQTPITLIEVLH
jgi:adenine-specific DNA glycosylase